MAFIAAMSKERVSMIIDCHGHYTTTPPAVEAYRNAQKEQLAKDPHHIFEKGHIHISDDEIKQIDCD